MLGLIYLAKISATGRGNCKGCVELTRLLPHSRAFSRACSQVGLRVLRQPALQLLLWTHENVRTQAETEAHRCVCEMDPRDACLPCSHGGCAVCLVLPMRIPELNFQHLKWRFVGIMLRLLRAAFYGLAMLACLQMSITKDTWFFIFLGHIFFW